jgi:uncharacterized membrane protein YfcA
VYIFAFFLVATLSSVVGAICGIGGGFIIKPTLDLFRLADVDTINFLSGCTVLSMSCYSVLRIKLSGGESMNTRIAIPLSIGAATGGVLGSRIFTYFLNSVFSTPEGVRIFQAGLLAVTTVLIIVYTLFKKTISTHSISKYLPIVGVGLLLGALSSFLGIGGGPLNLIVLSYFFSMDTKSAAQNSLYIIFWSQLASLLTSIVTNTVPELNVIVLVVMIVGGIIGGIVGRKIYRRLENKMIDQLFITLLSLMLIINLWNVFAR